MFAKADQQNDKIAVHKEDIEANDKIRIISDEQSKQMYEVLHIPKIFHPFISGPNGDNIKKMTANHPNVRINIPPLSIMKDELSVAGETEGVNAVKNIITQIYQEVVSFEFFFEIFEYSDSCHFHFRMSMRCVLP